MTSAYQTGDRVCGYVFDAADGSGTRICIQLQDRCMDHPRHGVTGHAPFADRDSFHVQGRARDVMPTDDPDVQASILETARDLVARWMPELPWFHKPRDARVEDQGQP